MPNINIPLENIVENVRTHREQRRTERHEQRRSERHEQRIQEYERELREHIEYMNSDRYERDRREHLEHVMSLNRMAVRHIMGVQT